MKKLFLVAICFTLAACEAPPKPRWYKPGVSNQQTNAQISRCRYEIGINKISQHERSSLFSDCMEGNGFIWGVRQ